MRGRKTPAWVSTLLPSAGAFGTDVLPSDMFDNKIESMHKLGVTESYKLKRQVVVSASEAAEMILR